MTEAPATDQFVAALSVSDMGTLAAPTLVLPKPRTSPPDVVFEERSHCSVCEGPGVTVNPPVANAARVSKTI